MSVRVRYAPSPTGLQHIGGVRTALFNYFFARANGGKFILRIEDTDQMRFEKEALDDLYDTLAWLGIDWDEGPVIGGPYGPYIQSQRFELYQTYAQQLIDQGKAYRCYCTSERLEHLREEQSKQKAKQQGYDRHCRSLSAAERSEKEQAGLSSVIRLALPLSGKTTFHDVLMGDITRSNSDISPDPVLLKSDGFPTYHLANVIDDHLMQITHIMRAQEWIPSGALHILLYEAFGWEPPVYCHLPMVMGKDGQKLSKRHGSTAVREFREQGYLSQALINYVSMVGWSFDGQREFFSKEELEKLFSLEHISKSPGIFDYKKLQWYNGMYIRQLSDEQLAKQLLPYMQKAGFISDNVLAQEQQQLMAIIPLVKERLKTLAEIVEMVRFLYEEVKEPTAAELLVKNQDAPTTALALKEAIALIEQLPILGKDEVEQQLLGVAQRLGIKVNGLFMPIRLAITGSTISPPLLDAIELLGIEHAIVRLKRAISILNNEVVHV